MSGQRQNEQTTQVVQERPQTLPDNPMQQMSKNHFETTQYQLLLHRSLRAPFNELRDLRFRLRTRKRQFLPENCEWVRMQCLQW